MRNGPQESTLDKARLRPARTLAVAVAGWTFACLVMVVARVEDAIARGEHATIASAFPLSWPYFFPLILLSWGLQLAFAKWPSLTHPWPALRLFLAVILIFYPAYIIYEGLLGMWYAGKNWAALWQHLADQSRFGWWIDGMIVAATIALHFGVASRARLQARDIDLQREQKENAELRLALLQGQLEPHFLFNALNGVSALVRSGDRERSLAVLEQVSELLRYALRASRVGMLTVQDELDFVDRYLSLQSVRFGPRLSIRRQCGAADWASISCPPLLMQPLVENAVRHGVEVTSGEAVVTVATHVERGEVKIEVRNTVVSGGQAAAGNGIGVALVKGRLAAAFGDDGKLVSKQKDGEYVAAVSFPVRSFDE